MLSVGSCLRSGRSESGPLNLNYNSSWQAVKNISEGAMSVLNKPIKFAHLLKLANQSMFDGVLVIDMAKTSTVVFMKERTSSVVL